MMLYLTVEDIRKVFTVSMAIEAVRDSFLAQEKDVEMSVPRTAFLSIESREGTSFNTKMGYCRPAGRDGRVGTRIIGNHPPTYREADLSRFIVLSDAATTRPLAMLSDRDLYPYRVGASAVLAWEFLATKAVKRVAIAGAGKIGQACAACLAEHDPSIAFNVVDKIPAARDTFEAYIRSDLKRGVRSFDTVPAAASDVDMIVLATNAREALLEPGDVKRGLTICPFGGGWEVDPAVLRTADKVIIDDWDHCNQMGDIAHAVSTGTLKRSDLYGMFWEVVSGKKKGRTDPSEIIVAVLQGMVAGDVLLADAVYRAAKKQGVGIELGT